VTISTPSTPTRTTFWLVRHGEAENNTGNRFGGWDAAALTERGQRQAATAGAAILARQVPASIIVTSDLRRADSTAHAIAAATKLAVIQHRGLRERTVGIFDGMSFADAKAQHPAAYQALIERDETALPPGAETNLACFARVSATLDELAATYQGQTVIVVSHGIALLHMLLHVTGLGAPTATSRFFTLVDNASISVIEHYNSPQWQPNSSWRLCHWNDNTHSAIE
jgi:broad specificity phosphatase PhoE